MKAVSGYLLRCYQNRERAHYLLLVAGFFFLLSMHYHDTHPGGYGLSLPFNVLSWIPISWLIGLGFYEVVRNRSLRYTPLTIGLALSCLLLLIPSLYPASMAILSNPVFYALLAGLLVFVTLQQFQLQQGHMFWLFFIALLAALISAAVGWLQYFGLHENFSFLPPSSGRPVATFAQPNVQASFLVSGLLLSAFLLGRLNWLPERISKIRWLLLATPVCIMPLVLLLNSRTGWLAVLLGLMLILPWFWREAKSQDSKIWVSFLLAGMLLGFALIVSSGSGGSSAGRLNLDTPRTSTYPQTIAMIMERPFIGYGYGNFERQYIEYTAAAYAAGVSEQPGLANMAHPHNELMYWWAEGGLLALLALLLAAGLVLRTIFCLGDKKLSLALLALLFPITLHSQTEMPFFASVPHWFLFVLLIFLVDFLWKGYNGKKDKTLPIQFVMVPAVGSFLIPVLTTLFMLTTLQGNKILYRFESDPTVNISTLEGIINPVVWQDRLNWDLRFGQLVLGIYTDRPELALPYIEWAPELLARKPRGFYYQSLVLAYNLIGDTEGAGTVRQEAEYLLPNFDFNYSPTSIAGLGNWNPQQVQPLIMED